MTEKLDGSNVLLLAGQAYPRSVSGAGRHGWLGMVRKHHAWKTTVWSQTHFYGEDLYGVHAIEYDPMPEDETFRLFCVAQPGVILPWHGVRKFAGILEVKTVPELFCGRVDTLDDLRRLTDGLMGQPSSLGGEREGVVIRRAQGFFRIQFHNNVCKIVRPDHVQPDETHWSTHWRPARLLAAT